MSEDAEIVRIHAAGVVLEGELAVPDGARGVVLFAHGTGSSRFSPRNRAVAAALRDGGLATLLLDLLTAEEEAMDRITRQHRFDVERLAHRLSDVISWLGTHPRTQDLDIGLFGASTGAAAALLAATRRPDLVRAVVSRGGRPDLAGPALRSVRAPTLLIVGGHDPEVLTLNEQARLALRDAVVRLQVVPRATHLFEEPGALDEVVRSARDWFTDHLRARVP